MREDYVACHSLWWSRKCATPGQFDDVDVYSYPFGRHRLVQRHEGSGRMNLYVAAHVHHLERRRGDGEYEEVPWEEGRALIDKLMKHATRRENVLSVEWKEEGIWWCGTTRLLCIEQVRGVTWASTYEICEDVRCMMGVYMHGV